MPVKPPYKILIVTPTFGKFGGIEAMVLNLARVFNTNPLFKVKVCFKRVKGFNVTPELQNIFDKAKISTTTATRGSKELFRAIREADLIHAQNVPPDVILLSKLLFKPVLLHIHHWCRRNKSIHSILWRFCFHLVNQRTYVSNFVWNTWEPKKHKKNSLKMPSVPELTNIEPDFKNRKGFIFISRWIKNKGLRILLQAYQAANINKDQWPLLLVGDGPLRPWVKEFLATHPMPSVTCTGFLSQEEKAKKIASSKWLVAPPHTREDLGMTPIEARYLTVPSIITRDGGLPEAAGSHALICEPNNIEALKEQLEIASTMDEEEYLKRATEGKRTLSTFIHHPSKYEKIYLPLLKHSS